MQDLVPCVLVTFDKEQIVVWRGKDYGSTASLKPETEILSTIAPKPDGSPTEKRSTGISHQSSDDELLVSESRIRELGW